MAGDEPGPGAIQGAQPGAKGDETRDTTGDKLQHAFKGSIQEAWLETGTPVVPLGQGLMTPG